MNQTEREALEALRQRARLDNGTLEMWLPFARDDDDDDVDADGRYRDDRHMTVGVPMRRDADGCPTQWLAVASESPRERAALIVAAVNALPALLADSKALELAAVQVEHERARAERLEQAMKEAADSLANDAKAFRSIGAIGFAEQAEADERDARAALGEVKP